MQEDQREINEHLANVMMMTLMQQRGPSPRTDCRECNGTGSLRTEIERGVSGVIGCGCLSYRRASE